MRLHKYILTRGFTLVELLVTLIIVVGITLVAFNFFVSQLEINARSEAYQRQRRALERATKLIESEVNLSEAIITDSTKITQPTTCPYTDDEFKFGLNMRSDLYQTIYYTRTENSNSGYLGDLSLWRCGPSFDERGQYVSIANEISTPSPTRVLDGISTGGFLIDDTIDSRGKILSFTLSLEQDQNKNLAPVKNDIEFTASTRNNPLYTRPNPIGLCEYAAGTLLKIKPDTGDTVLSAKDIVDSSIASGQNILLCGIGQVNTINGSDSDDLIEAGGVNSTVIYGCNGADVIEGTEANDDLYGDNLYNEQGQQLDPNNNCGEATPVDGNDILLGKGNSEESAEILDGGDGFNQYVPGYGNYEITGGNNLDVVYFDNDLEVEGGASNYTFDSSCNSTLCTVTDKTGSGDDKTLTLTGVEILIFRDQRKDLAQ